MVIVQKETHLYPAPEPQEETITVELLHPDGDTKQVAQQRFPANACPAENGFALFEIRVEAPDDGRYSFIVTGSNANAVPVTVPVRVSFFPGAPGSQLQ